MTAHDLLLAIALAVAASLVLSLVEIPLKAKTGILACMSIQSFFYWFVLSFGNAATTALASTVVTTLPTHLSPYYFFFCAFFGVFAFEAILKNTNITMFDKGVLTIQNWIDKALNAAAADAIERQQRMKAATETKLVERLMKRSETDINTRILNKLGPGKVAELDVAATASAADPKLYKVLQLVTTMTDSERAEALNSASN